MIDIRIVNNSCIPDNCHVTAPVDSIMVEIAVTNITSWHEAPVVDRITISKTKSYTNVNSGRKWCPTIVITACSPTYPCWSPLITRYPHPSIKRIVCPTAVVERCPTPAIFRCPSPSVVAVDPMTTGVVRCKTGFVRNPNLAIRR
jgi:hypothetical protein